MPSVRNREIAPNNPRDNLRSVVGEATGMQDEGSADLEKRTAEEKTRTQRCSKLGVMKKVISSPDIALFFRDLTFYEELKFLASVSDVLVL